MIKSMTGFGRSELRSPQGHIRVEIKSVNHKFLEVSSRLPSHLTEFDDLVRKAVSSRLRRGKVMLFVTAADPAVHARRLVLNERLAKQVHQNMLKLRRALDLKESMRDADILREVLRYPDVLTADESSAERKEFSATLERAVALAAADLERSRSQEGRALRKDLIGRLAEISKALIKIRKRVPATVKEYRSTLEKKVRALLSAEAAAIGVDKDRLTQEAAQFAKNSDISEEITRLSSHLDTMKRALGESGEVGRKIDFIAQEMHRETNTIGSKSADVGIAEQVILIKSAIEKIREQSQNVE